MSNQSPPRTGTPRRRFIYAGLLWVALTLVGEYAAFTSNVFYPVRAAAEAALIDDAFRLLLILGTPVFTFVVAGLVYTLLAFRAPHEAEGDGPPIHTSRPVTWLWLAVTSGLAVFVIFNPGLKGIRELNANPSASLIVHVEAKKWEWTVFYPQYDLTLRDAAELVLPVNRRVQFEITSADVIHSFWVPAFRMKMDAVPGQTNVLFVTPNRTGDFAEDINYRLQCAELCGTGHARMRAGLRIVTPEEFEQWTQSQ